MHLDSWSLCEAVGPRPSHGCSPVSQGWEERLVALLLELVRCRLVTDVATGFGERDMAWLSGALLDLPSP